MEINKPQDESNRCYEQINGLAKENHELKEQLKEAKREMKKYEDLSQRKQFLLDTIEALVENF